VALLLLQQRHLLDVQSRLSGDLLGDLLRDGGPDPAGRLRAVLDRAAAEPGPVPLAGTYDGAHVLLLPAEPDPGDALRRILAKADQAVGPRGLVTLVAGPAPRVAKPRGPTAWSALARMRRSASPGSGSAGSSRTCAPS